MFKPENAKSKLFDKCENLRDVMIQARFTHPNDLDGALRCISLIEECIKKFGREDEGSMASLRQTIGMWRQQFDVEEELGSSIILEEARAELGASINEV